MSAVVWSLLAVATTLAGGLLALRLHSRVSSLVGFTSGVLLGVVAFDLVPELVELSQSAHGGGGWVAIAAVAAGYLLWHGLERFARGRRGSALRRESNPLWSVALIAHSAMDGVGIGLAFQAEPTLGWTVAGAVVAHDFCDGLSTVNRLLADRGSTRRALAVLALDALAPLLGAAATVALDLPSWLLLPGLGLVAGFLLYLLAGTLAALRPSRNRADVIAAPMLGATCMYLVMCVAR